MSILPELAEQISIMKGDGRSQIPNEYGHPIVAIIQAGQIEAMLESGAEEQIRAMKAKAEQNVVIFGVGILNVLSPALRVLIQPEDIDRLEQAHQVYVSQKSVGVVTETKLDTT